MTVTTFRSENPKTGQRHNIETIVEDGIFWKTNIDFSAGELFFTLASTEEYQPQMGDRIRFAWDEQDVFYGFVFKTNFKQDGTVDVTALDKLRYLKSEDTLIFEIGTIEERFTQICKAAGIDARVVSHSNHKLEAELFDGKTYFDMLKDGMDEIKKTTGQHLYLRDRMGTVELVDIRDSLLDCVVGDKRYGYEWSFENSIEDTYNVIKLVKSDGDKNIQSVITQEGDTVSVWGRLQKVEKAEKEDNEAKMVEKANNLLKEHNRIKQTLTLPNTIGILEVQAGVSLYVDFEELGRVGLGKRRVLATKVTHMFRKDWSMDLEVEL